MQWAEELAALFGLVFCLAPFVSNDGVAGRLRWLLVTTLSDDAKTINSILLILLYWGIATIATALSPVKVAAFTGWTK